MPTRGGGAGGFNPATGQGGIRPIPGDIIQNQTTDGRTEAGALNIWLTPHGFLKGAAANAATAKTSTVRGKRVLSFTAFGKYTVTGTLSERNLVERVETRMDVGFTGDTLFEGHLLGVPGLRRREVSDAHRAATGRISDAGTEGRRRPAE